MNFGNINKDVMKVHILVLLTHIDIARLALMCVRFKTIVYEYFKRHNKLIIRDNLVDASKLARWPCLPFLDEIIIPNLSIGAGIRHVSLPLHAVTSLYLELIGRWVRVRLDLVLADPILLNGDVVPSPDRTRVEINLHMLGCSDTVPPKNILNTDTFWTKHEGKLPFVTPLMYESDEHEEEAFDKEHNKRQRIDA
jgi:hypothetical protein